jgi:hypothetical protein
MRFSLVRLLGQGDVELPWFQHSVLTIALLAVSTVLVLIMRASGFTQGAAFGFILDFTGAIVSLPY